MLFRNVFLGKTMTHNDLSQDSVKICVTKKPPKRGLKSNTCRANKNLSVCSASLVFFLYYLCFAKLNGYHAKIKGEEEPDA